jgi:hypothetical protein
MDEATLILYICPDKTALFENLSIHNTMLSDPASTHDQARYSGKFSDQQGFYFKIPL